MFTLQPFRFDFHSFRARLVGLMIALFALSGAMLAFIAPAAAQTGGWGQNDPPPPATVLHVAEVASPGGDGSSWAAAFTHPQQALDAAVGIGGSVLIKIAQGRYVPTLRTDAADPRSVTFQLRNSTVLSGGYAGPGESDPDARNTSLYESILSGDINGDDAANFVNYEENAFHVLIGSETDATAVLDGLIVSGGNASVGEFYDPTLRGGGLYNISSSPTIVNTTFRSNKGNDGGGMHCREGSSPTVIGCAFIANSASGGAGASYKHNSPPRFEDCVFFNNVAEVAGGVLCSGSNEPSLAVLTNCTFVGNSAIGGGGGAISIFAIEIHLERCQFIDNHADLIGGAAIVTSLSLDSSVSNCVFRHNSSGPYGGALILSSVPVVDNCVISNNECEDTGAVGTFGHVSLVNSTISSNTGHGIYVYWASEPDDASITVMNSIIWGNTSGPVYQESPDDITPATFSFSNIEGGWTGAGTNNIDEDPLFIQTSCGNLRLAHDSPCIDAGSNSLIPAGVTTDLAGNPRIQNGTVDMGAYEGGHDILPPAACADYLAQGINVRLVPNGGEFSPLNNPAIVIRNEVDPNLGNAMVMQHDFPLHPSAGGFNEIGSALQVTTSIPNGGFWMRVILPFTPSNLNGFDPEDVELTFFDEKDNEWKLAASANLANSPGHSGPLGDRLFTQGTTNQFGLSPDLGDYGVFWNPQLQQGFAWANVDHATEFAIGVRLPQCIGDCAYPGDGLVNPVDVSAVITAWGLAQNGPLSFADITVDGRVGTFDLLEVINHWGPCP